MGTRVENIRTNVYVNDKTAGKSLRSLSADAKKLRNEIYLLKPGTEAFVAKTKQFQQVQARVRGVRNEMNGVNKSWSNAADKFNKFTGMITVGIAALTGLGFSLLNITKRNADLSDSMADVQKTTQLAKDEVEKLYKDLGRIDTRTSRKELLKLAETAGRLGKTSRKDILEFVKVADQLSVALGDDLGGESAIKDVGKLTEQFKVAEKEGVSFEKGMLKLGSALNEVSASGSNQAAFLVDFSKRMAPAAANTDILAGNIIGLGAALDEAGQTTESSGTAISKIMVDMFNDTAKYAEIAQMSVADFSTLLETDANEAFLKMIEGLKGNNDGFTVMADKLKTLGLDGAKAINVLSSLANNLENVRDKQNIANQALTEGTSLTKEFELRNNNLAASWEKIQRAALKLFVNGGLKEAINDIVGALADWIKIPLSTQLEEDRIAMLGLRTELLDTNIATERRVAIINELKETYPEYLGNIDAEKISNEELLPILDEINNTLIKKIALQKVQETLEKKQKGYAEALADELRAKEKIAQLTAKVAEENNIQLQEGMDVISQASILWQKLGSPILGDAGELGRAIYWDFKQNHKVVDAFNKSVDVALADVKKMSDALDEALGMETHRTETTETTETSGPTVGEIKQEDGWLLRYNGKAWVKIKYLGNKELEQKEVDSRKRVLEAIRDLEIQLEGDAYLRETALLDVKYERLIAQAGIEKDLVLQLEELKQKELINLMEEHLQEQNDLVLYMENELDNDEVFNSNAKTKKILDADQALISARVSGFKTMISATKQFVGENNDLFKTLFLADQASAVGEIIINLQREIAGISAANATLGVAGIPITAGQIAAAKVRAGFGIATIAAQSAGELSYAVGGYTGLGFGTPDHTGYKQAGVVHANEYVIPEWMMQNQQVANTVGMLEDIRTSKSFAAGGHSTAPGIIEKYNTTNTTVIDQGKVEMLLTQIAEKINQPAPIHINDVIIRQINDRLKRNETIENKSKLS